MVSPTESTTAKDKASMTREEREAKYKETRDRIFKGFEDIEHPELVVGTEISNEVSRASSTTGKKKQKKNSKQHNDDGFQARSQFEAFYPTGQYSGATYEQSRMASTMFFNPYLPQPSGQPMQPGMTQTYNSSFQPLQHPQAYPIPMQVAPMMGGPGPYPQTNVNPNFMPYGQQMTGQFFPVIQQPNQMAPLPSNISSPALSSNSQLSRSQSQLSEQHWAGNGYTNPYPIFGNSQPIYQQQSSPQLQANPSLGSVPYQYGQLPYQASPQNARSQHPVPGSYNRQAFNPQTRSFVPSNGFVPQQIPYGAPPSNPNGYNQRPNFQPVVSFGQQQNLQQQVPQISQTGQLPMTHPLPSYTRKSSGQMPGSQSPSQNTLSKWGTPANLPPKPPPPEGSSTSNPPTIQNMSAGQGIPTFQNGTYSKPSDSS